MAWYMETTPHFDRQVKRLSHNQLDLLEMTLKEFRYFLETGKKGYGLRFKKIGKDKYEFRINDNLRVACKLVKDTYYLAAVGDYHTIQHYLRNF